MISKNYYFNSKLFEYVLIEIESNQSIKEFATFYYLETKGNLNSTLIDNFSENKKYKLIGEINENFKFSLINDFEMSSLDKVLKAFLINIENTNCKKYYIFKGINIV